MNDRELLEMAAKAAGMKCRWFNVSKWKKTAMGRCLAGTSSVFGTHHTKPWTPLTDDGDAMRLSMILRIDVEYFDGFQMVRAQDCNGEFRYCEEDYGDDISAAVRRAIVRAAAMQASNIL